MELIIPHFSLVILIGASGSGKSTFARRHFRATEILSSDACRALVSDDENNLVATGDAFEVLHFIATKRLATGRLTVIDATNVQLGARRPLLDLARKFRCPAVAIVLDLPERLCQTRNRARTDRTIPPGAVRRQLLDLQRSLGTLEREGFQYVYRLRSTPEIDAATVVRKRPRADLSRAHERSAGDSGRSGDGSNPPPVLDSR